MEWTIFVKSKVSPVAANLMKIPILHCLRAAFFQKLLIGSSYACPEIKWSEVFRVFLNCHTKPAVIWTFSPGRYSWCCTKLFMCREKRSNPGSFLTSVHFQVSVSESYRNGQIWEGGLGGQAYWQLLSRTNFPLNLAFVESTDLYRSNGSVCCILLTAPNITSGCGQMWMVTLGTTPSCNSAPCEMLLLGCGRACRNS